MIGFTCEFILVITCFGAHWEFFDLGTFLCGDNNHYIVLHFSYVINHRVFFYN